MMIKIKGGKLCDPSAFLDIIRNSKDGFYTISPWKKARTNDQNNYYRALIDIVSKETGNDKDMLHEMMRMKFLAVPANGNQLPYCRSTTKLDTKEFTDYIEKMKNFMAENLGIILPSADERANFINK